MWRWIADGDMMCPEELSSDEMEREERNISKRWRDVFIYDRWRE